MADEPTEAPRRSVDITNTKEHLMLRNKYTQAKAERDKAQADLEELRKVLTARDAELNQLRPQLDQNTLLKENQQLKGQLREAKHWGVIERSLRDAGIRPEALEAVRKVIPYEAKGDEPDPEAIGALIPDWKAKHPYFFGDANGHGETPTPTPAPGRGQGGKDTSGGKLRVTSAQIADPMWTYVNRTQYEQAIKDKTLEIVD